MSGAIQEVMQGGGGVPCTWEERGWDLLRRALMSQEQQEDMYVGVDEEDKNLKKVLYYRYLN